MAFFEELGVKTKVERGGRVFPVSDHSSDVIRALERELCLLGVKINFNAEVKRLLITERKDGAGQTVSGLLTSSGGEKRYDSVIVATGGLSYPSTGSTGDGYRFAGECGHKVTELYPSLVPMEVKEWYAGELMGLSLRNVEIQITDGKKKLYQEFGEMLFTHFGVSGPLVLSASSHMDDEIMGEYVLHIDLKPGLSPEQLDARLLRDFEKYKNKDFLNALGDLLPRKMIPVMVRRSDIEGTSKVHQITRQQRRNLVERVKDFTIIPKAFRPINEAIVTAGGVSVKQVDPKTMESKLCRGLYFAGEVLDLDAYTGGFNLQIAFSTGFAAGTHV